MEEEREEAATITLILVRSGPERRYSQLRGATICPLAARCAETRAESAQVRA